MGGGSGGGSISRKLKYHVESCMDKYSTVEDVVQHLRVQYKEYSRMGQRTLTPLVRQVFRQAPSSAQPKRRKESQRELVEGEEDDLFGSNRKKQKKHVDKSEERLLKIENDYSRRKGKTKNTTSESESQSESESGDSSSAPSSTSEDGIYGEKVAPKIDLMRSMLRETYSPAAKKVEPKEKNIELEVSTDDKAETAKIDMINTQRGGGENDLKAMGRCKDLTAMGEVEVKGKAGPRFRDLGGLRGILEELEMEVLLPLYHPQVPQKLGVDPIGGILLHGPPGCGKTKLANAIANEVGVPFYKISATEVVSGVSGASEENIRELFNKAHRTAPSIIFIDEIDAIASKRENLQREMERRIVTQLMTCMDSSSYSENSDGKPGHVLVIGATNRPDAVDAALRRPGRFDREIRLGVPDENDRVEILSILTQKCTLEGSLDLLHIARATPGFVGADLNALVNKAGIIAMRRIFTERKSELSREYSDGEWLKVSWLPEEMEKLAIKMADFQEAAKTIQPSSRREGFSTIPDVKWEDVGGLEDIRETFERYIVRRIKCPEDYLKFGVNVETGILLYGPPGCGKTLIAKAAANEAGANFIHIKGPELLNKYVGESELAVRTLFSRARTCSPCVLFFDEVDALTTKRGKEGGWVVERLLNQLLIELDGADKRPGVFIIGATNRPEVMDPAVLRPGRFGKLLHVRLPSPEDRGLILKALAKGKPIDADVDFSAIGQMEACENLSGADLRKLVEEAAMTALVEAEGIESPQKTNTIKAAHFEQALGKISPSVSNRQIQYYHNWSQSFKAS